MIRKLLAAGLAAAGCAGVAGAQTMLPGEVFTLLAIAPTTAPQPVLGADGRVHLAFEVAVSNPSRLFMTLDKVEAVDAAGAVLSTLEGDALAAMTLAWTMTDDGALPPGGSGFVLLDVSLPADAAPPGSVSMRVTTTRRIAGPDGKPAPLPGTGDVIAQIGNTGNSDGPHLHFQVMDGPAPLKSGGLPYGIRAFASQGVLAGDQAAAVDAVASGKAAVIDQRLSGAHAGALPLNNEVVDFD